MAAQLAAQTKAAGAQAVAVPGEIVAMVNQARERRAGPMTAADANQAGLLAVSLLGRRDRPMTQQAADATLAYLEALPNLPDGTLQRARQAANRVADRPTRGPGAPALTPEQAAQEAGRQRALEAVYHSSKLGYAGAFEGEAEARKRKSTTAPADTAFATADDALSAYLDMLEDGIASADELARITGRTAEEAERDFRYAKGVYADAKAKGAYQNQQKKYFEPSVACRRPPACRSSNGSFAKRHPKNNGRSPKKPPAVCFKSAGSTPTTSTLQFRGTPKYDYLRTADRIFGRSRRCGCSDRHAKEGRRACSTCTTEADVDWKLDDLASEAFEDLVGCRPGRSGRLRYGLRPAEARGPETARPTQVAGRRSKPESKRRRRRPPKHDGPRKPTSKRPDASATPSKRTCRAMWADGLRRAKSKRQAFRSAIRTG